MKYIIALVALFFFSFSKPHPRVLIFTKTMGYHHASIPDGVKAIQQLGKVEKALIYLYMEDQPYDDIAATLGISQINVRVRLNRVKNKLKEIIKTMNYEY